MSDVLSQEEIDALLDGLSKGEIDAELSETKTYRVYDFRRPTKFSKDNLRTLQFLHETFARQLATTLTGYLRINTECKLDSMEQVTYEEFLRSLPSPTLICICNLGDEEKPILLEMSLSLAFGIIDRLLGGPGVGEAMERELTEIEQSVIEDVITRILVNLSSAWSAVVEVDFQLQRMEFRPQFVQVVFPTEIVLTVSFESSVGSFEGFINLCFPFTSMQEILDGFNTEKWFSERRGEERRELALKDELAAIRAPLSVVLGKTRLPLADIKRLKVGQVIRLDTRVDDLVVVKVGKTPAFTAWPGTVGKHLAVRINARIEDVD